LQKTTFSGYFGGDYSTAGFNELLVRWYQFGAFCPIFRTHGHRQPSEENEICGGGGGPNEVWTYQHADIITKIIMLRESIRPYVEFHLRMAHLTGTPITRPMVYDFPDVECYNAEDQFMFGPDWLVAPVLVSNATHRSVYLPTLYSGQTWSHYYTQQSYPGGQRVNISVTLADFPLFQRIGSTVDISAQ